MNRWELVAVSSAIVLVAVSIFSGYELYAKPHERLADWLADDGDDAVRVNAEVGEPIVCTGSKDLVVEGAHIETDEDAVVVRGSCDITLVDSTIKTSKNGIVVRGSGDVKVRGSEIEAGGFAVVIQGSGDVRLDDTTVTGDKGSVSIMGSGEVIATDSSFAGEARMTGSGELHDEGGNTWD